MTKILIVDDEKNVRRILRDYFENEGFEVYEAPDGESAIDMAMVERDLSLILLDVRMPGLSGFDVFPELCDISNAPIIFLTAMDEVFDEVKGLSMGANDYITKPFNYSVLMARVRAAIRKNSKDEPKSFEFQALVIDFTKHNVIIEGESCGLSLKEYDLLKYLFDNKGISLSRQQILDRIWGYDYEGDPRTMDTHIKTLRSKLGDYGDLIKTVRGVGYRFEIPKY